MNINNPLFSSELRWFSQDKHFFHQLYKDIPGNGWKETKRTDYYLKYKGTDTGVKIREGKHEIKVMNADKELRENNVIEHWAKWSTQEERHILNTLSSEQLGQWLPIVKERWKKMYSRNKSTGQIEYKEGFTDDGCGVEFTILQVRGESWYTFGLEAFGMYRSSRDNLVSTLEYLKLPALKSKEYWCFGYPSFITELLKKD